MDFGKFCLILWLVSWLSCLTTLFVKSGVVTAFEFVASGFLCWVIYICLYVILGTGGIFEVK